MRTITKEIRTDTSTMPNYPIEDEKEKMEMNVANVRLHDALRLRFIGKRLDWSIRLGIVPSRTLVTISEQQLNRNV